MTKLKAGLFILCMLAGPLFFFSGYSFPGEKPRGETLLFSKQTGPNWQIWTKNLSTGEDRQITFSKVDKRSPQSGPSGEYILYRTANSELILFDLTSGEEKKMLERFGAIMDQRFSPDGQAVSFSRLRSDRMDDSDIWISDLSGRNAFCLTQDPGLQYNPVWAPDQQHIAFVTRSGAKDRALNLWLIDRQGEERKQLTRGQAFDLWPDFSPDGHHLAFSSNRSGQYDIWLLEMETLALKQLTRFSGLDTTPAFSPDGEKIAFISMRSGSKQIWTIGKNGQNLTQKTFYDAYCQDPCWWKHAQTILFKKSLKRSEP